MLRYSDPSELTRRALSAEEQLCLLHQEASPWQLRLRWAACLLWCLLPGLWLVLQGAWLGVVFLLVGFSGLLLTGRERRLWRQAREQASRLAGEVRGGDAIAPLLDFARWQGSEAVACFSALERLLPQLDTHRAQRLTDEQRRFLRHCVENQEPTVELTIAALLVLGSLRDPEVVPIARSLATHSSSQRIRDAALLCLEELEGSGG